MIVGEAPRDRVLVPCTGPICQNSLWCSAVFLLLKAEGIYSIQTAVRMFFENVANKKCFCRQVVRLQRGNNFFLKKNFSNSRGK